MDATLVAAIPTSIAALGGVLSIYLKHRMSVLQKEMQEDADMTKQLLGRIAAMEFMMTAAARREGEMVQQIRMLEKAISAKDVEIRELTMRYEALKENYSELSERHRLAEAENRRMKDHMLVNYIDHDARKSSRPPPPFDTPFRRDLPPKPTKK